MISIFDMFKIGIGPSSSHTVGPMRAGVLFRQQLIEQGLLDKITRFSAHVYGSLSNRYAAAAHTGGTTQPPHGRALGAKTSAMPKAGGHFGCPLAATHAIARL